jgi:Transposase DDE domain
MESLLGEAEAWVAQLKEELEADPAASTARQRAARERAARERIERTNAALRRMRELEAERARREKTDKKCTEKQKAPRASTIDAEARVMHMADHGYRPAYNGQFASDPQTQVIVAVDLDTTGSDSGLMAPMRDRIAETYGQVPQQYLVDGGFSKLDDIEQAHAAGTEVFAPPPNNKHQTDPFAARKGDGPGTAAWRKRMASDAGKAVYRDRVKHECVNAQLRNCGVVRLLVRGREKVRAVLLWFAVSAPCHGSCAARVPSRSPRPMGEVCPTRGVVQPGRELGRGKPEKRASSRRRATAPNTPGFCLSPRRSRPRPAQTICFTASRGRGSTAVLAACTCF